MPVSANTDTFYHKLTISCRIPTAVSTVSTFLTTMLRLPFCSRAAAEQSGKVEKEGKFVFPLKVFSGNDICCHGRHKQADQRSHHRRADGHSIGAEHIIRKAEYFFIRLCVDISLGISP